MMRCWVFSVLFSGVLIFNSMGAELYVGAGGANTSPYDTWAKAAQDIPTALGLAIAGDTVWVSNGVYVGSMGVALSYSNSIIITTGITVRSANGPEVTTIYGEGNKRCVYMAGSNTVIEGFTICGGYAPTNKGGGIYCEDYCVIQDCVLSTNYGSSGGGAYVVEGYVYNCIFETNEAVNGGGGLCVWDHYSSFGGEVTNCVFRYNVANTGGGLFARYSQIDGCLIYNNISRPGSHDAGGVEISTSGSVMRNSVIYSNYCGRNGGGVYTLYNVLVENCTIVNNYANQYGGGVCSRFGGEFRNCIIYGNQGSGVYSNQYWFDEPSSTFDYCCIAPLTNTSTSIDSDPQLDPNTMKVWSSSPCVDAGLNQSWMATACDVDGHPRICNEVVDIGAYEAYVGGVSITGGAPIYVEWTVPIGATCQWQTASNVLGPWSNSGVVVTAETYTISRAAVTMATQGYYRVIWELSE